jgi:BirA family biotin operon repressor/biotin-[acetyl-CoA-carboxylase] ligase
MSSNTAIGSSLIEFDQLDSTNDYAMQLANKGNAEHGTTIVTQFQTKGKGQQGKKWMATKEKNLLLSIILDTSRKSIQSQFELNAACCWAIANMLMEDYEMADTSIKWPNDIYIGKKKIAGILIENIIRGQQWQYAIVGIGLNVNQLDFPLDIAGTSLHVEKKKSYDLLSVRKNLLGHLNKTYDHYQKNDIDLIREYNNLLNGYQENIRYERNKNLCNGTLRGVDSNGLLQINDHHYRHGDIKLLL